MFCPTPKDPIWYYDSVEEEGPKVEDHAPPIGKPMILEGRKVVLDLHAYVQRCPRLQMGISALLGSSSCEKEWVQLDRKGLLHQS